MGICIRAHTITTTSFPPPYLPPHPTYIHISTQEDAAESLCTLTFAQRVNGVSLSGAGVGQKGGGGGGKGDAKNARQAILQARGEAREAEAARYVSGWMVNGRRDE